MRGIKQLLLATLSLSTVAHALVIIDPEVQILLQDGEFDDGQSDTTMVISDNCRCGAWNTNTHVFNSSVANTRAACTNLNDQFNAGTGRCLLTGANKDLLVTKKNRFLQICNANPRNDPVCRTFGPCVIKCP
ncbi:hypothetical protein BJ170DRAFT_636996 [Xylariales sp. AK1849]|nr:hypothetical protein BJ170DRAFT_636996 [Xylariales sp. AK1849]